MTRYIQFCFTVLVVFIVFLPVLSSAGEPSNLKSYLEQALVGNASLERARAEFRATTERIRVAGVLPDPKITVQYYLEPVQTRTGPQEAAFTFSQSVPWFNKLSLLRELSNHEAAISGAKMAAVELEIVRQVKEAYIEYGYLGHLQQTINDTLELLRYLEGVTRSRYTTGKTTYFDVLKIQIELAKVEEKKESFTDQAAPLRIHINNLLGSERDLVRAVPATIPLLRLSRSEDAIVALALENSPLLTEARERVTGAGIGKELAEREQYPDFTFSLKTIVTGNAEAGTPVDSGNDPVIAGVMMNIPIFQDRHRGKIAAKEAVINSAKASKEHQEREIVTGIERALYAYREAKRKIILYHDDLLPKINQQLEVAINGFQSGQSSILELIDAQQSLFDFQLAESRAVANKALAVARLEARTGVTLAEWTKVK